MFVHEDQSDIVLDLLAVATIVGTSRITYVECRAALSRAMREERLSASDGSAAARNLDDRWGQLQVVELDEILTRTAGELTRSHPLRAADAIHLASADLLVEETRDDVLFASWDRRLWVAALSSGFVVSPTTSP